MNSEFKAGLIIGFAIGFAIGTLIISFLMFASIDEIKHNEAIKAQCEKIETRLEYQACMRQLKP